MFHLNFDPDKMWVLMKVFPYPRTDIEWEAVFTRLRDCAIYDIGVDKPGHYTIFQIEILRPCIFFEISRKQLLFFGGETFQASLCGPDRRQQTVLFAGPCGEGRTIRATGETETQKENCTRIDLTLFPPESETERFKKIMRRKEYKTGCYRKCEKIMSRYFGPIKKMF